jgi:hypothetical protein
MKKPDKTDIIFELQAASRFEGSRRGGVETGSKGLEGSTSAYGPVLMNACDCDKTTA